MTTIYLIRHGKTKGNLERRYVGRTDEPLCEAGRQEVSAFREILMREFTAGREQAAGVATEFIEGQVYVSPLLRCRQTAELLFADVAQKVVDDLREMDFGDFEYKNYTELAEDVRYQAFIDSGGSMDFPNAETQQQFRQRVRDAFARCMSSIEASMTKPETDLPQESFVFVKRVHQNDVPEKPLFFVVHGGTIMAILEAYAEPHRDYFDWQIATACGYRCELAHTADGLRLVNVTILC